MDSIGILFPCGNAARQLSVRLIESGKKVVFYVPNEHDIQIAKSIIGELRILAREKEILATEGTTSRFIVGGVDELKLCNIIVLPTLDTVKYRTDEEYKAMVEGHFQFMETKGFSVGASQTVIFGDNFSGLLAAGAWASVWPDSRSKLLVTCSIYRASIKVFGRDSDSRALPMHRSNGIYFTNKSDDLILAMGKQDRIDDFSASEAKDLHQLVSLCLRDPVPKLGELEIIGKYPTEEERSRYGVDNGIAWVPTRELHWHSDFLSS